MGADMKVERGAGTIVRNVCPINLGTGVIRGPIKGGLSHTGRSMYCKDE